MKIVGTLALAVAALGMTSSMALAGAVINVNVGGYLPPPPGVEIFYQGGRPCYRDGGRVVYLEKDERHHGEKRGHAYGHRKHGDHGRGYGHNHGEEHGGHGHGGHGHH